MCSENQKPIAYNDYIVTILSPLFSSVNVTDVYLLPGSVHYKIEVISGSGAVPLRFLYIDFFLLFHHVLRQLITVYIVWSMVRRRVTRRLTKL